MKLAKKLTCTALAACTALSLTAGVASAIDVGDTTAQPAAYGAQEQVQRDDPYIASESYIVPDVKTYFETNANTALGPYWKLWVYNNADTQMAVSIIEEATGQAVYSRQVGSKSTVAFRYNDPDTTFLLTTGKRYHVRMSSGGGDLTGSGLALKASSNPSDVAYKIAPELEVS